MEVDKGTKDLATAALRDSVLPGLVLRGAFGQGWSMDGVRAKPIDGLGLDHWASVTLVTVLELSKGGEKRSIELIAKWMRMEANPSGYCMANVQVDNEIVVYSKLFPLFARVAQGTGVAVEDLHPKWYVAESGLAEQMSLLLMDDMRAKGFRLAESRAVLSPAHLRLVMRAAGRLHAMSYGAKARFPSEFLPLASALREVCYREHWKDRTIGLDAYFQRGLDRASARLGGADDAQGRRRRDALRRLEAFRNRPHDVMVTAATASEPVSVVAHGDMCRNNMLFRYDDRGQPVEVCFFDFQNTKYCSPAMDLSFFLCMHTSPEIRAEHWDGLLREYHDSLTTSLDRLLKGHTAGRESVIPTMQDVRDDLRRHALWGYVLAAFFLPSMMVEPDVLGPIFSLPIADRDRAMLQLGGDAATELLADLVIHFADKDLIP